MRDARRMQEKVELKLERAQLVWLTLGAVLTMGLSFALGLVVGRRAAHLNTVPTNSQESIAQLDADSAMHRELTFYKRLMAKDAAAQLAPLPKKPLEEPKLADIIAPPPAAPVAPEAKPKPVEVAVAPKPEPKPSEPAVASDPAVKEGMRAGPAKSGEFTVQVSAFQTIDEAKAYGAALERKGFKPFIVTTSISGKGTWYRVRLGRFQSEDAALVAKKELSRSDIPGWVLKSE